MKKCLLICLTALVCVAPLQAQEEAAAPTQVLGILDISNMTDFIGLLEAHIRMAGVPVMPGMVTMGIYGTLGIMSETAISQDATIRIVAFGEDADSATAALWMPVPDRGEQYLAGLVAMGWEPVLLEIEDAPDGLKAFKKTGMHSFPFGTIYIFPVGEHLLMAEDADDLRRALALPDLPAVLPVEGTLAVQVGPGVLWNIFGSLLEEGFSDVLVSSYVSETIQKQQQEQMETMFKMVKQMEALTLGIGIKGDSYNLHFAVQGVEGSLVQDVIAAMQAPAVEAGVAVIPGALATSFEYFPPAYYKTYVDYSFNYDNTLQQLRDQIDDDEFSAFVEGFLAVYRDILYLYAEEMTGSTASSLLAPTPEHPLRAASYTGFQNADRVAAYTGDIMEKLPAKVAELWEEALAEIEDEDDRPPFNLCLEQTQRAYRDVEIKGMTLIFEVEEDMEEWPAALPKQFSAEQANLGHGLVGTFGGEDVMDQVLDRALSQTYSRVQDIAAWQALFPDLGDDVPLTSGYAAIMDIAREVIRIMAPEEILAAVPAIPGDIGGYSYVQDDTLLLKFRFRPSMIIEIKKAIQAFALAQGGFDVNDVGGDADVYDFNFEE